MSTRSQREKSSRNAHHTAVLAELLREEANRYCADCGAKGPRWASWNIGCFLCIRCAGIHRNLGVHISRVKSVNLDSWTPEQLKNIQEWGNRRCKAYFECFLPEDFRRPQTDSAMETFIRNKYERKQYIKKDGMPPKTINSAQDAPPSLSKPLKEAKIERPKKEKKKDESVSVIPLKDILQKPSAPAESRSTTISSLAKPRPHPQQKTGAVKSNCDPPSADLLSLDHPVTVNQQAATNPVAASGSSVQELIDFGGFQGHNTGFGQSDKDSSAFATEGEKTEDSLFKDDSKSTKDSIMALYRDTSAQQPQMFGVPGGMYIFPQQNTQPQQQQMMKNTYGRMASGFQQPVMPVAMPQQQYPSQQTQQVTQLQQQLQQMHVNNPLPNQQPSFVTQRTFNEQTSSINLAPQRPVSIPQQPSYFAASASGPTSNNSYGFSMYHAGAAQAPTGQTLSHSLWQ